MKRYSLGADMVGQCTVYVNAKTKKEALSKILAGNWDDAEPEGWDVELPEEEFISLNDIQEVKERNAK